MARRREGDWFAVPLGEAGYAVGLVARAAKRGDTLFGYFFGPLRAELPSMEEFDGLTPSDAVLVTRFEDEALESGDWPILASTDAWERDAWPMPEFHMPATQALTGESFAVRYSEDAPHRYMGHRPIALHEERAFPPDHGAYAPGRLANVLRDHLGVPRESGRDDELELVVEEGVRHFLLIPRKAVDDVRRELSKLGFGDVSLLEEREGGIADVEVYERGSVEALQSSVDGVEARLSALAERHSGEYDGREWALPSP